MTDAQFAEISQRLANLETMQHDFIHNLRIFGFVGFGMILGAFAFYILLKEVTKKW